MDIDTAALAEVLKVNNEDWAKEVNDEKEFLKKFPHLEAKAPQLLEQLRITQKRLNYAISGVPTSNERLLKWVAQVAHQTQPGKILLKIQ